MFSVRNMKQLKKPLNWPKYVLFLKFPRFTNKNLRIFYIDQFQENKILKLKPQVARILTFRHLFLPQLSHQYRHQRDRFCHEVSCIETLQFAVLIYLKSREKL